MIHKIINKYIKKGYRINWHELYANYHTTRVTLNMSKNIKGGEKTIIIVKEYGNN